MKNQKKALAFKEKIKKNWKKIVICFVTALGIISLLIAIPLLLQNDANAGKFNILREKNEKYDFSRMIVLKDQTNVNVSKNKNRIKKTIIAAIEKAGNKLSQAEKNSIKFININSWDEITHKAQIFSIQIKSNPDKKTYDFYLMRKATSPKELIEQKLSRANVAEKAIILDTTNNLDLENPNDKQKLKQGIIKAINAKNKSNKLTKEEENAIIIYNQKGIVKHDEILTIQVAISILAQTDFSSYDFHLLRTPSNVFEKYESLKAKLDKVDLIKLVIIPKSSYAFKTNDDNSLNYMKSLIFDHINKYNRANNLNKEEKATLIFQSFGVAKIPFRSDSYKDIKFSFVLDKKLVPPLDLSFGFVLKQNQ